MDYLCVITFYIYYKFPVVYRTLCSITVWYASYRYKKFKKHKQQNIKPQASSQKLLLSVNIFISCKHTRHNLFKDI